jgi:2'-5' RNA ligase
MYFISILAPEAIDEQVTQWKKFMRDRFGCIVALKSPAHITLIPPFWMKTDLQPLLEKSIDEFSITRQSFLTELESFDCFRPRVIFVQVKKSNPLESLKIEFERHLRMNSSFPIRIDSRPFHPHITIANRDLRKRDFIEAWEHFKNKTYQATFPANGITLLKHTGIQWAAVHTGTFPSI